jgi:hypothetical protein
MIWLYDAYIKHCFTSLSQSRWYRRSSPGLQTSYPSPKVSHFRYETAAAVSPDHQYDYSHSLLQEYLLADPVLSRYSTPIDI